MVVIFSIIVIILSISHLVLRKFWIGSEKEEISREGKKINLWGKAILAFIAIITNFIILTYYSEGSVMKWFFIILIIVALGFQSWIDWKYVKNSKQYKVSIMVLILGVILVLFLM